MKTLLTKKDCFYLLSELYEVIDSKPDLTNNHYNKLYTTLGHMWVKSSVFEKMINGDYIYLKLKPEYWLGIDDYITLYMKLNPKNSIVELTISYPSVIEDLIDEELDSIKNCCIYYLVNMKIESQISY